MERLTDKLIKRINRSCLLFILMPLGALIVLTVFCWKLIYNCMYGPFPADAAMLSSMKSPDLEAKYYVTVTGVKAFPTGYFFSRTRGGSNKPDVDQATDWVVALVMPPRLLLIKTLRGELATRYTGKLETVPRDLVGLVKQDFNGQPDLKRALLPMMLNVSEGIAGELAIYEAVCLILVGIASFNGGRLLLWKNIERHPLARALRPFGNFRDIAEQINQEGIGAVDIGGATITNSWLFFPKPFGLIALRIPDIVWAYISTGTGDQKKPGGVCIWTKDERATELSLSNENRAPLMTALSERAPWIYSGYDAKLWLNWKTNPKAVVQDVEQRQRKFARK